MNENLIVNLERFLDEKNSGLWNLLVSNFNIEVRLHLNGEYELKVDSIKNSTQRRYVIFVSMNGHCQEAFTHELLHINLKYLGIDVHTNLTEAVNNHVDLKVIFNKNMIDHLNNFLEHSIMFPMFLEYGYAADRFLSDYYIRKMDTLLAKDIISEIKNPSTRKEGMHDFIGGFISLKCCPNSKFNYDEELKIFYNAEPQLYMIMKEFWEKWQSIIVQKKDYRKIKLLFDDLISGLDEWRLNFGSV